MACARAPAGIRPWPARNASEAAASAARRKNSPPVRARPALNRPPTNGEKHALVRRAALAFSLMTRNDGTPIPRPPTVEGRPPGRYIDQRATALRTGKQRDASVQQRRHCSVPCASHLLWYPAQCFISKIFFFIFIFALFHFSFFVTRAIAGQRVRHADDNRFPVRHACNDYYDESKLRRTRSTIYDRYHIIINYNAS